MWQIKRILPLALAAVMLLASCSSEADGGEALIRPIDGSSDGENLKLVEVSRGSVSRSYSVDGSIRYSELELVCEFDGARIVECPVSTGDTVVKGQVLARFEIESSAAELRSLESELEIAKTSAEQRVSAAETGAQSARDALESFDGESERGRRRLELALEHAEITLEQTRRSTEKSVEAAREALDEYNEKISQNELLAPADGYIASMEFRQEGSTVPRGARICTLVTYDGVSLHGTSELGGAVRYGALATVSSRLMSEPFEARVVSSPNVVGAEVGDFQIELPEEISREMGDLATDFMLMRSAGIRIEVERFRLDGVLVLPSGAVSSEDGKRFVYVLRDGELRKRFISVGISDGEYTQVLDGLELGERVSVG